MGPSQTLIVIYFEVFVSAIMLHTALVLFFFSSLFVV